MSIFGDFGKLRGLKSKLQSIAHGALTRKDSTLMSEAVWATREALTECFLYQRDPEGVPWAPRKHLYRDFRDTNPILFDLLSYFEIVAEEGRVKVTNRKYYAFFHQTGTRHMVARKFVPAKANAGTYGQRLKKAAIKGLRSAVGSFGVLSSLVESVLTRIEGTAGQVERRFERENRRNR